MERLHLDQIDRQILTALTDDARIPLVTLASRVHLSRNAVKQRIERMERQGVIGGYSVVPGRAGASPVSAIVLVYRSDRMRGGGVVSQIAQIPEVRRCDVLSGDFDLLVTLEAESMDRIGEIWEILAALPGVANTVTAVSLTRVVDRS
ncbi:Leucine-responsive regulatory protein [Microbacterium sp. Bi98]|uniref:Lrp/AsnC family transcriptional regulator n=1 Tax=unclassified Microbacterium TaxID=2609290 RepID=UPI0006F40054|nr:MULTISPECIES: Lrp/AsnC family transcriptional regulator [unclassified Microbacterium]KRD53998.1 AsnC family transcriptional regulator [Microbacterium sp. Root280D1]CAH0197727.1 Leucine-responsive regulatory protein [Microbacterium sp. Bi98]